MNTICLLWTRKLRRKKRQRNAGALHESVSRQFALFYPGKRTLCRRAWRTAPRKPRLGKCLPSALAARQNRALHPRGELHRLVFVADLCEERSGYLGNPADQLPAHPARFAEPRTARLPPRRQLQLVSLQRQPGEIPENPRRPAETVAGGAQDARPGRGVAQHCRRPGKGGELQAAARPRWFCPL